MFDQCWRNFVIIPITTLLKMSVNLPLKCINKFKNSVKITGIMGK